MESRKLLSVYKLCVVILLLCFAKANELRTVEINIQTDKVLSEEVMGVGYNFGPLWIPTPKLESNSDLEDFFSLFENTKTPWIRIMLSYYEWECKITNGEHPVYENDDNNPWTKPQEFLSENFKGFAWNTKNGLDWRIKYTLDFCEKHNIWVEINNWETWMKRWLDHKKDEKGIISYQEALEKAQEFGENFAALIYYLKTKANNGKGYDCIKYYALWNEPGGGYPNQDFVSFDFPGYLNLLHKTVYDHLAFYDKQMGSNICEQIKSIGFESFATFRNSPYSGHPNQTWKEMLGKGVIQYLEPADNLTGEITNWPSGDPYMDIISLHEYWVVFDYDKNNPHKQNKGTISDRLISLTIKNSIKQISQYDIDDQIEPLIIGEMGAKAYLPKGVEFGSNANYSHMLCVVESFIRSFQSGMSGGSIWAWNMHSGYASVSYPGCWWEVEPLGIVHPINANYYPYILLTRNIKRNSDVLSTEVIGGIDDSRKNENWPVVKTQRVWASAFRTPDSKINLIVVNDSYDAYILKFNSTKIKPTTKLFVTEDKYDKICTENLNVSGSKKNVLPARSICVYNCD